MTQSDDDAPPLTAAFFQRARPMAEVHSEQALEPFKARRGRPKSDTAKKATSIRLDQRILDAARNGGPQWQTRINDLLLSMIVVDPVTGVEALPSPKPKATKAA